ncbi:cell wall hydrolase [Halanaerobium sp. MA284_MarDTE_T2]|uniref:cell wall hydrolase n=1 Tax=Halanaerobium sp. MA284_MarDTE_T2 TaxID=2183913 RepID=UPI000DF23728|nr:cell wall hydrolase [Halanaerobium sp. MA284_MarDTE_T2]RCW51556.1 N-acetylmuramoyl-L-alanine amidase [Halanaerobium sp. MA284_MarDTE_T2]
MKGKYFSTVFFVFLLVFSSNYTAALEFKLVYVVQDGDTLSEIAEDFSMSVKKLKTSNNIESDTVIKVGDELIIPEIKEKNGNWEYKIFSDIKSPEEKLSFQTNSHFAVRVDPGFKLPDVNIPADKLIDYYVSRGDTLYDLARDFNTSIGVIMALNDLQQSSLRIGQKIKLPVHNLTPHQILGKTVSKQELNLLARAIYGEARGEPFIGQIAVGAVIINRVLSSQFPNTFAEVIYQNGQFSCVSDGQINLRPNNTAFRAAREAINGKDPTKGALYFYNPKTAANKSWFKSRRVIVDIGEHVFTK